MFRIKNSKQKLQARLEKLLEEAYRLSHSNRRKSDEKTAQAEALRKEIEQMD